MTKNTLFPCCMLPFAFEISKWCREKKGDRESVESASGSFFFFFFRASTWSDLDRISSSSYLFLSKERVERIISTVPVPGSRRRKPERRNDRATRNHETPAVFRQNLTVHRSRYYELSTVRATPHTTNTKSP